MRACIFLSRNGGFVMNCTGITALQKNGNLHTLLENAMPWKPEKVRIGEKAFCTILSGHKYVIYLDGDYYFPDKQDCDLLENTIIQISNRYSTSKADISDIFSTIHQLLNEDGDINSTEEINMFARRIETYYDMLDLLDAIGLVPSERFSQKY